MPDDTTKGPSKIPIDMSGPNGNIFSIMGLAKQVCKDIGKEFEPIQKEMNDSGDYFKVLEIFEREFGDYYELENKPKNNNI